MGQRLTIVGAGLIGASFARAARTSFQTILALEPQDDRAQFVVDAGIVDARVTEISDDSGAVLLACPSNHIADWVVQLADHPGTVFDTGSVKGRILAEVEGRLGFIPKNFIPTHPIAGLERSGPEASDPSLFRDKMVIVTPVASTEMNRKQSVVDWWRATGARIEEMDPDLHDATYARTSHLPHLLVFAYLQGISTEDLAHTGGGFRDFSRIGGSDPEMWSAIFDRNQPALLKALDDFEANLAELRGAIETADLDTCKRLIEHARTRRRAG